MFIPNRRAAPIRLRRIAAAIRLALCQLHHVQFDAPWNGRQSGRC